MPIKKSKPNHNKLFLRFPDIVLTIRFENDKINLVKGDCIKLIIGPKISILAKLVSDIEPDETRQNAYKVDVEEVQNEDTEVKEVFTI